MFGFRWIVDSNGLSINQKMHLNITASKLHFYDGLKLTLKTTTGLQPKITTINDISVS